MHVSDAEKTIEEIPMSKTGHIMNEKISASKNRCYSMNSCMPQNYIKNLQHDVASGIKMGSNII